MAPTGRSFERAYRRGRTPWDTGVTPPEVVEEASAMEPGRALDLGCGTGTNVLWLAQHGWTAVGVDRSPIAIESARRRADWTSGAMFVEGDVTRLEELQVDGPFDLMLDIGCFHGLPVRRREAYVRQVARVARRGARMMVFASGRASGGPALRGRVSRSSVAASVPCSRSSSWCLGAIPKGRPGSSSDGVEAQSPA